MRVLSLTALLALAACGALPQPLYGNPGAQGALLAQPPPSRLAVQYPAQSLLSDDAATAWAQAVADALNDQEIPADARPRTASRASRGDWTLTLAAELQGSTVVPNYTVINPAGVSQGTSQGTPVPVAQWASGSPQVLKAAAVQAAPAIASLLGSIEAARRQSDPNSLQNRPTRIYLAGVTGAPGDGNRSLPRQMRIKLEGNGFLVQDTAKNADFEVKGEVSTGQGINGTTRIELQWIVSDARSERGRILQINEVDPRSINPYWGDTAVAAATEASNGVKSVINNATNGYHPGKPAS
jgi:hypothetical protein